MSMVDSVGNEKSQHENYFLQINFTCTTGTMNWRSSNVLKTDLMSNLIGSESRPRSLPSNQLTNLSFPSFDDVA